MARDQIEKIDGQEGLGSGDGHLWRDLSRRHDHRFGKFLLHLKALSAVLAAEPLDRNLGVQRKPEPGILSWGATSPTSRKLNSVQNNHRASRGHRNINYCFAVARREVLIEVLRRPSTARAGVTTDVQRTSNGRPTDVGQFVYNICFAH